MSTPRKSRRRQQQLALPGVGESLPRRKPVARSDGKGWDIAVLQSGSAYVRLGSIYSSEGKAWQAIQDGVGLPPREPREVVHVSVYISAARRRR